MPITHIHNTDVVVVYAFGGMAYLQTDGDNKHVSDRARGISTSTYVEEVRKDMKAVRHILLMAALLALAFLPLTAAAQTTSTVETSGFQVQNLSNSPANITVQYISATTQAQVATQTATIPAGGSLTFVPFSAPGYVQMSAPAGFRGSVVILSDQPIVAVTNILGANAALGDSYGGFTSGATSLNLPLIVRDNFGIDTAITVQNVGDTSATVNISYVPGIAGNPATEPPFSLAPGASKTIFQKDNTALGSGAPGFVGSATITATGNIVATVLQEGNGQLTAYNAFPAGTGSPTVALPLVLGNNFGAYTGIQVLNAGTLPTTVTINFAPNTVTAPTGGLTPCTTPPQRQLSINPNQTGTLIQDAGNGNPPFDPFFNGCIYIGGATVTSNNNQPLFVIVNQVNSGSKDASSYAGFNPTTATDTVLAPLVAANNFGTFSGVQVQNIGTTPTLVTITYGPNTFQGTPPPGFTLCSTPTFRTISSLQPGASFTFLQTYIAGQQAGLSPIGSDSQFQSCMYVGSATITAGSGGKIAAIVNQVSTGPASNDKLFTYGAFAQ